MLKFMRHQQKLSPERLKKQQELFAFTKACNHGFPAKPSALAWDHKLRLLALACRNGDVRVYGKPGVEFYGHHQGSDSPVVRLIFLPGQGRLVSLCEDNSLHLWQLKEKKSRLELILVKSTSMEGKLKKISALVADSACEHLMVGTEGGNIYLLNLATFNMTDNIIYQDVVMQNVPEDYKVNPGPVEAIAEHPTEPDKILIGYQRGLIVLWDKKNLCADQTYTGNQQLESLCFHQDATSFISSHNDGSYVIWAADKSPDPQDGPNTVYGPFPCKAISKIEWHAARDGDFIIFSGGMPRASYGDRNTVTAIQGETHATFNLTSKVVDFVVVHEEEAGGTSCLVVLAEEEVVFIDLGTEDWPSFPSPYLASLHTSAITCTHLVSGVITEVFDKIQSAGSKMYTGLSTRDWPINGGNLEVTATLSKQKNILLTGHEDGTVRFWDASGVTLTLLYKLSTAQLFVTEDLGGEGASAEDDDWPPFRKAGLFDPYSDDPRLGVKKLKMCPYTGTMVVAGTAGQILILSLCSEEKEEIPQCVEVNLVGETDNFVWKSHHKLDMRTEAVKFEAGMQPKVVIQFYPPASCTSLDLHSEWGLVACGTAHGFSLFDYIQKKNLLSKCTLSAMDLANAADEGPMSRRKSLKKSLRESFRRLRRGRSQRKGPKPEGATSPAAPASPQKAGRGTVSNIREDEVEDNVSSEPSDTIVSQEAVGGAAVSSDEDGLRPVERAIEARTHASDYIGSMVRCLHLTKCFIANSQHMSATLWAGTNSGAIYVFTIAIPSSDKRSETPVQVQLGKEIHLKHGAPVISVSILDASNRPYPESMAVKKEAAKPPDTAGPNRVLICSEEQFKVFTLPQLKPFCKFKLTAHEGSRVRKIGYGEFFSSADETYMEPSFMVVTNLGDLSVFSLPDCRRQFHTNCIKKEDINGINTLTFSSQGEGLFLLSPSELQRISLSTKTITKPEGTVTVIESPKVTTSTENEAPHEASNEVEKTEETKEEVASEEEERAPSAEACGESNEVAESEATGDDKASQPGCAEAGGSRKAEEIKENGDTSVLSGDITVDSIRDHLDELKVTEKVVEKTSSTVKQETSSSSVTIVKSTTVTSVSSGSQESSSVQVVETTTSSTEVNHNSAVNGNEV
ncbi:LLGL domain-containing protein l(2)gl isoform X2 [Oratosquilla oratoria]|uniref:LLGL domain-containing protein l(2)gl isoform X2 n=1 Tax=Oratosquilla oratoria TaxID=337810 RepID=UPI003F76B30E